jgi:hypothetical protein
MIWVVHLGPGFFTHPGSGGRKGTGSRSSNTAYLESVRLMKPDGTFLLATQAARKSINRNT